MHSNKQKKLIEYALRSEILVISDREIELEKNYVLMSVVKKTEYFVSLKPRPCKIIRSNNRKKILLVYAYEEERSPAYIL
jgi:hypothetical protein